MTWAFFNESRNSFSNRRVFYFRTGLGILANLYSPALAVTIGTALFTFLCISLYIKTTVVRDVQTITVSSEHEQNMFLSYLLYLAFFPFDHDSGNPGGRFPIFL